MILRDQGNTEMALVDFGRARVELPDLAWIALEHAKAVAPSDALKARKLLKQASEFLGDNDARVLQARVQLQVQIVVSSVPNLGRKAIDWLRAAAGKATKSQLLRRVMELGPTVLLERLDEFAKSEPEQVELLREIINRWPDRVEPREELAARLLREGNYSEAVAQADGALALAPDSANLLGLKAQALDANGDIAEAVRFYRRASRAAHADDEKFDALIHALVRADRREEALNESERRLARFKNNGRALAAKGELLYTGGRFKDAAEALQAAEPLVPDDLRLTVGIQLAQSLRELDRYGDALQALERAGQIDNALGDAHAHKALFLAEIAEYEQAAALLQWAIGKVPADASDDEAKRRLGWLWSTLGWVLRRAGRTPLDQLTPMLENASTLDPDNAYAKRELAWLLMQQPDSKERGERLIRELIEQHADIPNELLAWCHFMLKQYEGAEHWLRNLVRARPTDIEMQFDLALVLLAMRQDADAKEYAVASKLARGKSAERRRGLFDVALGDLIDAHKEGCVDRAQAKRVWQDLWRELQAAGLRRDALDRLQYPVAKENAT